MTYEEKLAVANKYLAEKTDEAICWDDLSDINSLHDCETEEEIKEACDERLDEDGFPGDIDSEGDDDNDGVEDEDLFGQDEVEEDDDNSLATDYEIN